MSEKVLVLIKNKIAFIVIATSLMNFQGLEVIKVLVEATEDVDSDIKVPAIGIKGPLRPGKVIPEEKVKTKINFRMPVEDDTDFWQSPQLILDLIVNKKTFDRSTLEFIG